MVTAKSNNNRANKASKKGRINNNVRNKVNKKIKENNNNKFAKLDFSDTNNLNHYRLCLLNPFDPRASGVKTPDTYAYPTVSQKSEGTITVFSNGSGVASGIFLPHLYCSFINMCTDAAIGTSMSRFTNNTAFYSAVTRPVLADKLSNVRVICTGLEIRNLVPQTTCTGRIIIAKVPCLNNAPGYGVLESGAFPCQNFKAASIITGIEPANSLVGIPSSIITLPGAMECSLQNIITNKIALKTLPISPEAHNFHPTDQATFLGTNSSGNNIYIGTDNTFNQTNGVLNNFFDYSETNVVKGHEAVLFRGEGMPYNIPVFEIKYIFHIEGTPVIDAGSVLVPAQEKVSIADPVKFERVKASLINNDTIDVVSSILKAGSRAYTAYKSGGMSEIANIMAKIGLN
jgi:hypothetical protein